LREYNFKYKMEFTYFPESVAADLVTLLSGGDTAAKPVDPVVTPVADPVVTPVVETVPTAVDPILEAAAPVETQIDTTTLTPPLVASLTDADLAYLKPYLIDYVASGVHGQL
jgi:hypothetical protein